MRPTRERAFRLACSVGRVLHVVRSALEAAGLRVIHVDTSAGVVIAERPPSFWWQGNSVRVTFQRAGDETHVTVRSESMSWGVADWGRNERLIAKIEAKLRLFGT